jgi:oligopeptide/dipeptide ABC transporter ATP-binding protein
MPEDTLLEVHGLVKHFPLRGGVFAKSKAMIKALDGVSFRMRSGETLGIVGESGCGKTTLGRLILRLLEPTSGEIRFDGRDITRLSRAQMRPLRKEIQIIFQDPYSSLDPRMKVAAIVTEPLAAFQRLSRGQRRDAAAALIEKVGLRAADIDRYPHEFSGGQRQRIGIARTLSVQPRLIVADEPVSALDVSIQAQIINLLDDLKDEFHIAYMLISHDLSVVEHMCDRIAVMYLGVIVEMASAEVFSTDSFHPYTRALLAAVPLPDPHAFRPPVFLQGDVPSPLNPPAGCAFHTRCSYCFERCRLERPRLVEVRPEHYVACWLNAEGGGRRAEDGGQRTPNTKNSKCQAPNNKQIQNTTIQISNQVYQA